MIVNQNKSVIENYKEPKVYRLYRRRWIMLIIVTLLTAENIAQWLSYSAIDIIIRYHFSVSSFLSQLLSLNNLAIIMIFGLPSIFVVNKTDLKASCLTSGVLSLIALWVKFFGTSSGGYYFTICGQVLASFGTCFVLPLPAQLASIWFGVLERSTATSIAASGLSFGMGFAYLFSVQFVPDSKDHKAIQDGLQKSIICQAIICSLTIIATVLLFEREPPSPPSRSQACIMGLTDPSRDETFWEYIWLLLRNRSYIFTLLGFGIVSSVLFAFFSLLSDIVQPKFSDTGWLGFLGSIAGVPGMLLTGLLLDKTKSYKKSFVIYTALIALTTLSFTFAVKYSCGGQEWIVFVLVGLFGFLTSGLTTIGFVLGGELTYPLVPEIVSTGLLLVAGQFFGVLILGITSYAITAISVGFVNWLLTATCFLAFLFTPFVKADYRRLARDVLITEYQQIE